MALFGVNAPEKEPKTGAGRICKWRGRAMQLIPVLSLVPR